MADKLGVIDNLLKVADTLIIGGGMAYTFLKSQGLEIGDSLLDAEKIDTCAAYLEQARASGKQILLPVDVRIVDELDIPSRHASEVRIVDVNQIPVGYEGADIGPKSEALFAQAIAEAKTVFWNGPMGVAEIPSLAGGTESVAKALADSDAFSVIGGGDSAAAVRNLGYPDDSFGHISTGGGASLEYLEGKELPGLAVLEEN